MVQILADVKEAWLRASYADYVPQGTTEVSNKLAARSRLFITELSQVRAKIQINAHAKEPSQTRQMSQTYLGVSRMFNTIGACAVFETLFYLPNHFRQTILVNSSFMNFLSRDAALLDLMNVMFKINRGENMPIQSFKLRNFFACYRPFFAQTLPYECISLGLRLSLFDSLAASDTLQQLPVGQNVISGAVAGSVSQLASHSFFLTNLRNQNCFNQTKTSLFDKLPLVMMRGALLGVCHLSVYKTVLDFIEQPLDPFGTRAGNVDLLTNHFIFAKKADSKDEEGDGDRILAKLCLLGYFDQRRDDDMVANINRVEQGPQKNLFINLMLASLVSSMAIALVVTPFDMVFFKMIGKTANMTSRSSFTQIARDVFVTQRQTRGTLNALAFATGATFMRSMFLLTSVNAYLNTKN